MSPTSVFFQVGIGKRDTRLVNPLLARPVTGAVTILTSEPDSLSLFPAEASLTSERVSETRVVEPIPIEAVQACIDAAQSEGAISDVLGDLDERNPPIAAPRSPVFFNPADSQRAISSDVTDEVTRIGEMVSALEGRACKLTESDHPLAIAEARARQLELRSTQIAASFEAIAIAAERQTSDLAARVLQTAKVTDQVSALETRIEKLTEWDQAFAISERQAGELDRRSGEITAQLQRSVEMVDGQTKDVVACLAQVGRASEQVPMLEARLGKLIERCHALQQADGVLGQLEHRVAETTASLKRARKAHDELEREVARSQQQISTLRQAARKEAGKISAREADSRTKPWMAMSIVAGVTGVALAGIIGARPVQVAPQELSLRPKQSIVAASVRVLPSRPVSLAVTSLPTGRPWRHNNSAASTAVTRTTHRAHTLQHRPTVQDRGLSSNSRTVSHEGSPRVFMGALAVKSNPAGSAVFLNRTYVGDTPVQLNDLRAGSHVVWITRQGYQRWTASVLVAAEKLAHVEVTLQQERER